MSPGETDGKCDKYSNPVFYYSSSVTKSRAALNKILAKNSSRLKTGILFYFDHD